jgi:hypothetical protein
VLLAGLAFCLLTPSVADAQQSKSAALASEVAKLLDARKLDSIAAQVAAPNDWVGALYFPGSQLLVVAAKYAAPARLEDLLSRKNYRDIYIDLNGAAVPNSRVFISDLGANGLQFDRNRNQPFDTVETADGKTYAFDGDWGRAKISRDEYTKAYQATDEQYVAMLQALLTELKKSS